MNTINQESDDQRYLKDQQATQVIPVWLFVFYLALVLVGAETQNLTIVALICISFASITGSLTRLIKPEFTRTINFLRYNAKTLVIVGLVCSSI